MNKTTSTRLFISVISLFSLIIGICVGFIAYNYTLSYSYEFVINGDDEISIVVNGTYNELGACLIIDNNDMDDIITTTIYDSSFNITSIDTSIEDTYYVKYSFIYKDSNGSLYRKVNITKDPNKKEVIESGNINIHFLELGNANTGDCVLIQTEDNDILIDAGSKYSSIPTLKTYIDKYVSDNKLEYVIATHAHEDHIAGFCGNNKTGLLYYYDVDNIITYAKQNTTSKVSQYFDEACDYQVTNGATRMTALESLQSSNHGQYEIGEGITLNILYNYYYENKASSENDYSVCTLINQGNEHYFLFTGDLEENGEKKLVDYYSTTNNYNFIGSLPEVDLYKAGHHGSKTSSSDYLLSIIKPKVVCVCCCAGNSEYTDTAANQFPTQTFIDNIAKYTKLVYVTTLGSNLNNTDYESFNGSIIVSSGDNLLVSCSNNDTPLYLSDWFKNNRETPDEWKN